jgi:type II secretory pathway pseudopilin PulG
MKNKLLQRPGILLGILVVLYFLSGLFGFGLLGGAPSAPFVILVGIFVVFSIYTIVVLIINIFTKKYFLESIIVFIILLLFGYFTISSFVLSSNEVKNEAEKASHQAGTVNNIQKDSHKEFRKIVDLEFSTPKIIKEIYKDPKSQEGYIPIVKTETGRLVRIVDIDVNDFRETSIIDTQIIKKLVGRKVDIKYFGADEETDNMFGYYGDGTDLSIVIPVHIYLEGKLVDNDFIKNN